MTNALIWDTTSMAWEWVGPAATAFVGVCGIAATVITQQAGRQHALLMARDAMTQDRRKVAYERILLTALRTTEFVEYADVIWSREGQPPDVDHENYDMWILADLYTTPGFRIAYDEWQESVGHARVIGDEGDPSKSVWDQGGDLPARYRRACTEMRSKYEKLVAVARAELAG
ncbi:hypothetical protein ACIG47_13320 [Promicromonospora sp. NPDC052451]|uniref:hypothetical protein n=1 Tax=Promicromonospora sp. NPDC052451 TaxID=3364407 RepID=UPI0037C61DE8